MRTTAVFFALAAAMFGLPEAAEAQVHESCSYCSYLGPDPADCYLNNTGPFPKEKNYCYVISPDVCQDFETGPYNCQALAAVTQQQITGSGILAAETAQPDIDSRPDADGLVRGCNGIVVARRYDEATKAAIRARTDHLVI